MTHKLTFLFVALAGIITFSASTAYAGCEPACKDGEQCRYESAGGKFYCEAIKNNDGVKGKRGKKGNVKGGLKGSPGLNPKDVKTEPK